MRRQTYLVLPIAPVCEASRLFSVKAGFPRRVVLDTQESLWGLLPSHTGSVSDTELLVHIGIKTVLLHWPTWYVIL